MTITIYNSKNKEQKKFHKETRKIALATLDRIQGKAGWWAKAEHDDGDSEVFRYGNGEWYN